MSRRKHTAPEHNHEQPSGRFSFQLSLRGILGIGVVLFCLFLWMFLLGIWAGQTILYPPQPPVSTVPAPVKREEASRPTENVNPSPAPAPEHLPESEGILILPGERKKRVAQPAPPASMPAQ